MPLDELVRLNLTTPWDKSVAEFLEAHECDLLFQVHSIAPLLTVADVRAFVQAMIARGDDALMSVVRENLECAYEGELVNFNFAQKTNSQDLTPVERIVWAITG